MAELTTPRKDNNRKIRTTKLSTRIDLTAMVDLGFLLITFFMLATTFNKQKAMEVINPLPSDDGPPYNVQKTLTIMVGNNNKPYYYIASEAALESPVDSTDFSRTGLREIIRERQQAVGRNFGNANQLFVMVKPLPKADYRNVVEVLDEMAITNVKKYALVPEFNLADSLALKEIGQWF